MGASFTSKRTQGDRCEMSVQSQENGKGEVERYKTRLVAKGYSRKKDTRQDWWRKAPLFFFFFFFIDKKQYIDQKNQEVPKST